ncbi:MAG: aconitase X catalytic domain-containing protein [Deltaproteobacteria bacterium]|nr:aconitase X catalytic domain-containing protein [Deltaproteobacteria bacterium]
MQLTDYEKRMLEGGEGPAPRFAMEVLVKLGQIYGADRLVEVSSAQIMAHYGSLHDAGLELAEKFVALGGRFIIPTTEDPLSICDRHWRDIGIPEEYAAKQERLRQAVLTLGAQPAWTCTPYLAGNLPRFGQNVSWAESSAVSFANSVLGARTNRTPAGLNYCAALTGRMPRMGLYRSENRRGQVLVRVAAGEMSSLDYNTLGLLIGKSVGNRIPVVEGLPDTTGVDDLKYLGAAAASSGVVALYHAPGLTPEATAGDPFAGDKPQESLSFGRDDFTAMQREMTTAAGEAELGVVGCPHYSVPEMQNLAGLLRGQKLKPGCELWVYTSPTVCELAQGMGLVEDITAAGARIMDGNCLVISPLGKNHYRTMVTDSAKAAYYLPSEHQVGMIYTDTAGLVSALVEG